MFGSYKSCPHFNKRHEDIFRIEKLEAEHNEIIVQLAGMSKKDEEQYEYIKKHMVDEAEHHNKTNEAIRELAEAVTILVEDKRTRDIEEEVGLGIARKSEPTSKLWFRVKLTAVTVITSSVIVSLFTGISFVYDLYKKLNGE